jgi:hypothetical protein
VTLPTLREQPNPLEQARSDQQSVIRLARRLIRIPSRAGIDPYEPILDELKLGYAGIGSSPDCWLRTADP